MLGPCLCRLNHGTVTGRFAGLIEFVCLFVCVLVRGVLFCLLARSIGRCVGRRRDGLQNKAMPNTARVAKWVWVKMKPPGDGGFCANVSIYQGFTLGTYFDPHPNDFHQPGQPSSGHSTRGVLVLRNHLLQLKLQRALRSSGIPVPQFHFSRLPHKRDFVTIKIAFQGCSGSEFER